VAQAVAQRAELADGPLQLLGLVAEQPAIDAAGDEHARYLVEREAGRAAERDQGQPLDHAGIEEAAQAAPAGRLDEALRLVEAQRRGRHSRAAGHLADVEIAQSLDLKST
jgi:hypothetical protein